MPPRADAGAERPVASARVTPLVTVVIPVFERPALVAEAIRSALDQSYPEVEIIVVDDGSRDGTPDQVARQFGDRVRLVRLPVNMGRSTARNTGCGFARGSLIAFLDSDDAWTSDKLAQQVPHFEDPRVALVHCRVDIVSESGAPLAEESAGVLHAFVAAESRGYDYPGITETWCRMYTPAVMVRRDALVASGGFDPRLSAFEDWDVFWRIALTGRVATVPRPLVHVRRRAEHLDTDFAALADSWLLVNRKHLELLSAAREHLGAAQWRRAHRNLLLNMSLGEFWRGDRRAARRWIGRALRLDPGFLLRRGRVVWGAPLLHSFLPAAVAAMLVRLAGADTYRDTSARSEFSWS